MKFVVKIVKYFLLGLVTFFVQFFVATFLPEPFVYINVIFLSTFLIMVIAGTAESIVWGGFLMFAYQLFSAGSLSVHVISFLAAIGCVSWLLHTLFTNRSLYAVILIAALGIVLYHGFSIGMSALHDFVQPNVLFLYSDRLHVAGWEMLMTTAAITLCYLVSMLFVRRLNPRYIRDRNLLV